jgi:hypothetical protein
MRGDLYTGMVTLAGQFPPSLNTSDDVASLKPFESPACYGVDMTADGLLKSGSIPSGTTRVATSKTVGATSYIWHYDRMWRASGANLIYGAKYYDKTYVFQGKGKIAAEATIVGFQPVLRNDMWVYGGSGSQFIRNAVRDDGQFMFDQIIQEMVVNTGKATSAVTLDEIPYCANTGGVWSYNGQTVTELTRAVRDSLGAFATEPALTCDYLKKYIIGASKFAIDVNNGKLFDYSTSGFLFTSRTLVARGYRPYGIGDLTFSILFSSSNTSDGTISWETKTEDNDWFQETDLQVVNDDGLKTAIQVRPENDVTTARKFAIRITSMPSNIYIRSIDLNVSEYDQGTISA